MELVRPYRIRSIDILRGAIMIIMAIDHTRDFFHSPAQIQDPLDAATTTIPIYFTRWITHFCAPTFVFLSGVSAYLSSLKKTRSEASLFLIKRGAWLVLVEVTLVTFGITFNPFFNFLIFQVIWAIGWSMIILGILSRISPSLVLGIGIILFFGHNILDYVALPQDGLRGALLSIFLRARFTVIPLDSSHMILDIYAILPWTGVMLIGYSIGKWFNKEFPESKRRKNLLIAGSFLILLFIVLRYTNAYGNPTPWQKTDGFRNNLLNFLNTSKYPPSLLYLSMTLGPACIMLAILEKARGKFADIISVYGQVPFFFYVCHFYLIHVVCMIVFLATGQNSADIHIPGYPFLFRPPVYGWGLSIVYLVWFSVIVVLYFPCRWFSNYKKTHRQWWLSYI